MPRPSKSVVLALDLGSSSLRSALFTESGLRLLPSTASEQYSVKYTANGGAELSPNELLRAAKSCVSQTLHSNASTRLPVVCGSAFWHSLLGLDAKGRPTTAIYTWADSRSAPDAAELRRQLSEREIQQRTGCMLRAPYWPARLRWIRRTDRALFRRTVSWISPAAWIFDQLFGCASTSHSMASGTGLYNWRTATWDEELCGLCDIRPEKLGLTSDRARATIFSAIGDGAAGNLGSGADDGESIAINIGTSAAARRIVPKKAKRKIPIGLFKYVVDQDRAVIGGAISNAGNLHQWCLRELKVDEAGAERALSRSTAATDTLTVLPFWVEERAPTWPENLHGAITGLRPTTSAADILRAATTSTFYRLADILDQLRPGPDAEVIVSGGILHSAASLKILADCLGRDIRICRELEGSLRGAAIHALTSLGHEPSSLRPGKMLRHHPTLAGAHRVRRLRQRELEQRLR